ncbi:MAG TPA: TonB-dependent receptor, partial [Acidobacteriaceae bacterium]|nr:TonB-dependent receptor [Acidobacteriaceae bacterium]
FPAPTFATAAGSAPGNNYNFSETRQETMNEESLRIDHKLTDQDSIFGTWNYFRDPAFEPSNTLCGSSVLPKFGCFSNQFSTLANVTYDRIFSANLLNEVRFGFDRLVQPRVTEDNTAIGTAFGGLPGAFTQPNYANNLGLPNTTVLGYSTVGGATNLPQKRWDDHYQIVDELTWNHGPHTVKAGADLFLVRTTDLITTAGRGALTFNPALLKQDNNNTTFGTTGDAMADMLLGLPATTSNTPTAPMVYMNFQSYDFFGQDDWKITPSLTLNLGLRWEMDLPVYSPHNTFSNFQLASQSYLVAGPNTYQHLYHYDYNNFAPRVGFAYQPFHKETTVIKGAFGIYYDTPLLYNEFLGVGTQYPFRVSQTYTPGPYAQSKQITLGNPFPAGSTGKPLCATGAATDCASNLSPLSINPNYATPYITEWSLGVQRALSSNLLLEVTYFGTKGTRLPFGLNVNTIAPNTMGNAAAQSSRPYPNFLGVTNDNTVSDSSYNSLQVKLQRSYANGVSYLVAYTYGRSIDDGGGIGTGSNSSGPVQNPNNLAAERGPSDFNVQQRIVASPVAQLPFGQGKPFLSNGLMSHVFGGWSLMGIISAQTGRPFSVVDASTNNSGSFALGDRPNLVPGQNPNGRDAVTGNPTKTVKEWFNTHAFTLAPKGQFGNVGRNTITGPGYVDVDATVARSFDIYERLSGQFRLETFNLLNHPNFFNPLSQGMQYGTGAFGSITQANNNRELQGVVRFIF